MKPRKRWVFIIIAIGLIPTGYVARKAYPILKPAVAAYRDYGLPEARDVYRLQRTSYLVPAVSWPKAAESPVPISGLDSLRDRFLVTGTRALLLEQNGQLVYEWYGERTDVNSQLATAALAKPMVGGLLLLHLADQGVVELDLPVAQYIPAWKQDTIKSRITFRQLASHMSGLDDVTFPPDDSPGWFQGEPGWKRLYFQRPNLRFHLAQDSAPVLFPPESTFRYSGLGYYILAYSLGRALKEQGGGTVRKALTREIYRPIGIPWSTWALSYGESYPVDGLTLYALGSGAAFSPRALARIGQLVLAEGRYEGRQILPAAMVHQALLDPAPRDSVAAPGRPIPRLGWWSNQHGAWPSLPRDALLGYGSDDQLLLLVPSAGLVMVRFGPSGSLGHPVEPGLWLDSLYFRPLAETFQWRTGGPS